MCGKPIRKERVGRISIAEFQSENAGPNYFSLQKGWVNKAKSTPEKPAWENRSISLYPYELKNLRLCLDKIIKSIEL